MSVRIFFSGAAAGAIVGALAVVALRSERTLAPVADSVVATAGREETTSPASASTANAPTKVAQSAPDISAPMRPEPESMTESPSASWPDTVSPTEATSGASTDPGDEILREHAKALARGETLEQLTEKMHTETRDNSWASNMENELRDYLARQPTPNAIGSPSVECRTTICRIVSSVDDDILSAVPNTDVQAAMNNMQHESLSREVVLLHFMMTVDPKHQGQTIELALLRRAELSGNLRP